MSEEDTRRERQREAWIRLLTAAVWLEEDGLVRTMLGQRVSPLGPLTFVVGERAVAVIGEVEPAPETVPCPASPRPFREGEDPLQYKPHRGCPLCKGTGVVGAIDG